MTIQSNIVYRGDCIFMKDEDIFPDESVDLIYLDPPFNSNKIYAGTYKKDSSGVAPSFKDMWEGGLTAYIEYMRPRVTEMQRILKDTGSILYHCDHHASHYIRTMLDDVFGMNNFKNEIIWNYGARATVRKSGFPQKHDTILCYSKTSKNIFNALYRPYKDGDMKRYNKRDENGQYALIKRKRTDGTVYYGKSYVNEKGAPETDVWDIPTMSSTTKERVGYPTQKPVELLKRIILASSNQGDVVLDPFCGSGSTLVTCQSAFDDCGLMDRKFIGIDVSPIACDIAVNRLREEGVDISPTDIINLIGKNIPKTVADEPRDMEYMQWLAKDNPFYFQDVCCAKLGGISNIKKTRDGGIDGVDKDKNLVQIKSSPKVGEPDMQKFLGSLVSRGRSIGKFVAFSFTSDSYEFVAKCKRQRDIDIQLVCVKDLPNIEMASFQKTLSSFKVDKSSPRVRAPPIIQPTLFDY